MRELNYIDETIERDEKQASCQTAVSGSALFGYRFKITSNQNGSTLVTGFMTSSKPLDKNEQNDLFHNWTHGKYLKSENYVVFRFFKLTANLCINTMHISALKQMSIQKQ